MIRPNINLRALKPQPNPVLEWNDLEFSTLDVILATRYVKEERKANWLTLPLWPTETSSGCFGVCSLAFFCLLLFVLFGLFIYFFLVISRCLKEDTLIILSLKSKKDKFTWDLSGNISKRALCIAGPKIFRKSWEKRFEHTSSCSISFLVDRISHEDSQPTKNSREDGLSHSAVFLK